MLLVLFFSAYEHNVLAKGSHQKNQDFNDAPIMGELLILFTNSQYVTNSFVSFSICTKIDAEPTSIANFAGFLFTVYN